MSKIEGVIGTVALLGGVFLLTRMGFSELVWVSLVVGLLVVINVLLSLRDKKAQEAYAQEQKHMEAEREKQYQYELANSKNLSYFEALAVARDFVLPMGISEKVVYEYKDYWQFKSGAIDDPEAVLCGGPGPCVVNRHTGKAKYLDVEPYDVVLPEIDWSGPKPIVWLDSKPVEQDV